MAGSLLHHIALTTVPHIGDVHARILIDYYKNPEKIFKARKSELEKLPGIGEIRANSIKAFTDFKKAEDELAFIEKYKIKTLTIDDAAYPKRLLNCYDAPTVLYYRGAADLNAGKVISIIGTRNNTEYGKEAAKKIIEELEPHKVLVVSGLAYGVDSIAHKLSLKHELPTVGVLAHGLDRIYPAEHKTLAKDMLVNGGLLTDFMSGTKPDKQNFPKRNRIVAGIADAVLVIETSIKGGSMITAELANGYNKDVFAIPGRMDDGKSEGCNYLIKTNKAVLVTSGKDIADFMNWDMLSVKHKPQRELFIDLTADEKIIVDILKQQDAVHIDELYIKSGLRSSAVAAAILNLELQNVVETLPGKMYKLL
ncbi:MAG: DNA-processing protein DprA [Chitinophagaceae bacterium]|nr:DNA-processing protein DprA [Chitinophagaceae bacterium]